MATLNVLPDILIQLLICFVPGQSFLSSHANIVVLADELQGLVNSGLEGYVILVHE